MDRVIAWDKTKIEGVAVLPASKSISNRALVLCALAGCPVPENLSDSDDTRVLREALSTSDRLVNVGHAGTAMRFLTAYFALKGGVRELTGSERMKQRPVQVLVDALRELGASIAYMGDEGFPPLWITSAPLQGGRSLSLDASVSSQYVSALMMIAPLLPGGLTLDLEERIVSAAYIRMTAGMMRLFGVDVRLEGEKIIKITIQKEPDHVRVGVFNTGKPIPKEDLGRIWDKFYKVDKARTREYGGSGVGLSIVKAIMESMHQRYGVNNYDNGVEFWFELDDKNEV